MTSAAGPGAQPLGTRPGAAHRGLDATAVLTAYLWLLLAIPSAMVFAPLGQLGAPATILAFLVFSWWLLESVRRPEPRVEPPRPLRRAALLFLLTLLAVYVHAMAQPMAADELTPADSGLVRVLGICGLILAANDGVGSVDRWHALLRRLTLGATFLAALAMIQFATGQLLVDRLSVPGLTTATQLELTSRGAVLRPSATATHPIEFGVVLSMLLPIVITSARHIRTHRTWAWIATGMVTFAILLSVSRSSLICAVVAFVAILPTFTRIGRAAALVAATAMAVGATVIAPGLLGTLRGLFIGAADDPSVLSRTRSYSVALDFISANPWLGRGYGTFIPKYWILDNLYLQLTVEAGILGLLALLVLLGTGAWCGWTAARRFTEPADRDMARALFASVLAGAAALAFFDAFSFPQSAGILLLCLGLAGAAHRLSDPAGSPGAGRRSMP